MNRATLIVAIALLLASCGVLAENLLVEPSFENWYPRWSRFGTEAAAVQWESKALKWDGGHTGVNYIVAIKHDKSEPRDNITPVDTELFQRAASVPPGKYEASLWFKVMGDGAKWDGPGGVDQWTRIVVYLWADTGYTKLVRIVESPKIEAPVSEWHKYRVRFDVPAKVKAVSFHAYARLVDQYPNAWVAWDDAYLGPVEPDQAAAQPATNLIKDGDFELPQADLASTFYLYGDGKHVALDTSCSNGGANSVKMSNPEPAPSVVIQSIPFDCGKGPRRVSVSVDCKTKDVVRGQQNWNAARLLVWFRDEKGAPLESFAGAYDIVPFVTGTRDWTTFERTIIVPKGTAKLEIHIGLDQAAGTAWFDNAKLVEVFDDYIADEDSDVKMAIDTGKTISNLKEGLGWCWEVANPQRHWPAEVVLWPETLKQMAWDGPDILRVFVSMLSMGPPKEYVRGKDNGGKFTYDFDTPPVRNICKILEFCERRGINVVLANFHTGYYEFEGVKNSKWNMKSYYDGAEGKGEDWWMPYSKQRFAECVAELAYYLKVTKGFKCVKYMSLWNEPGQFQTINQYPDGLLEIYKLFDAELRKRGIRDKIRVVGMESVEGAQMVQATVDVMRQAPYIDVAAVHDYSAGVPVATESTPTQWLDWNAVEIAKCAAEMKTMRPGGVPLMMNETNGSGTDFIYGERKQFISTLGTVEYAIELAKAGLAGVLKWQYNQPGMFQFCAFRAENHHIVPNKQNYWPWAMVTRWTVRNSDVLASEISGGTDALGRKRVRAVALRAPGGQTTLIVTNDGTKPKDMSISLTKAGPGKWRHYYYDSSLPDGVREMTVSRDKTTLRSTLPAESVNVFTTFETGLTGDAPR